MKLIHQGVLLIAAATITHAQNSSEESNVLALSGNQFNNAIQLAWVPPTIKVSGYHIYRRIDTSWQRITAEPFQSCSYFDVMPTFEISNLEYGVSPVYDDGVEGSMSLVSVAYSYLDVTDKVKRGGSTLKLSTTTYWDQNSIITDSDFTEQSRMNQETVQRFLAAHGSILATFVQGGKTAAQLIYEAATNSSPQINPEVILAMIQKESGLITLRTLPSNVTVEKKTSYAMGSGAPNTFAEQLQSGLCVLRAGFTGLTRNCSTGAIAKIGQSYAINDGPKTVTPQNAATASLYRYNPYIGALKGGAAGVAGNSTFWFAWYSMFHFSDSTPELDNLVTPLPPQSGVPFEWILGGLNFDPNTPKVFISGQKSCSTGTCPVPDNEITYKSAFSLRGRTVLSEGSYGFFVQNGVLGQNDGGVPTGEVRFQVSKPSYGSISIIGTAKGSSWSGAVACLVKGPVSLSINSLPASLPNIMPIGTYVLSCNPNSVGVVAGITPSSQQTVTAGNTTKFTVDFGETISTPTLRGPSVGLANTMYTFTVSGATSNVGSPLIYEFVFGGLSTTTSSTSAQLFWIKPNIYTVTVRARSKNNPTIVSSDSTPLTIQIYSVVAGTCSASPNPAKIAKTITWSASPTGGSGQYSFSWPKGQSYTTSYSSAQTVTNSVTISDRVTGTSKTITCSNLTVNK